jgi:hypothetical protein
LIEVGRHGELAGAEAERAWLAEGRGDWVDFCERMFIADDKKRFSCLNAAQKGKEITLKVLHADGTHAIILAEMSRRTSRCGRLEAAPFRLRGGSPMNRHCAFSIAILFVSSLTLRGDEVELKKFTSKEGKFSALLPKDATTTTQNVDSPIGKLKVTMLAKEQNGVYYAAVYTDFPADKVKNFDANKSLDGARDGSVKNTGGKLVYEKKITIGKAKHPGREILVNVGGGKLWMRQRIYMVNLRQYQTILAGPEKSVKDKTADKFFQSFELSE